MQARTENAGVKDLRPRFIPGDDFRQRLRIIVEEQAKKQNLKFFFWFGNTDAENSSGRDRRGGVGQTKRNRLHPGRCALRLGILRHRLPQIDPGALDRGGWFVRLATDQEAASEGLLAARWRDRCEEEGKPKNPK